MAKNSTTTWEDRHPAAAALNRARAAHDELDIAECASSYRVLDAALTEAERLTSVEWVRQERAAREDGTHLSDAATLRILGVA